MQSNNKENAGVTAVSTLAEVGAERFKQNARFGEQNHSPADWLVILGEEYGEACKEVCEARFDAATAIEAAAGNGRPKDLYFAKQLLLARQVHFKRLRQELVQVAAVAVAMIESLDRNELAQVAAKEKH